MFTHNEQGDCTAVLCGGKTIFSYTYVYDSKGHVVSKVERDNRYNESTRASNYTYSSNGTLLSVYKMTNDADGSFWYDTRYNTDGSIASFESNYDGIKETYEYHTNGYLSQSVTQQSDERVTITYDKEGNQLLQEHTGEGYQYQTTFSYDDYGNLMEVRLTDTATGYSEVWESHQYTYNENGNLLTHIDVSVLDETETYVFSYDDNGNLRTKEHEGTRWVYAYDDNGNCLMIQLYRQGKLDATATFDVFGNMLTYDSDDQSGAWTYRLVYYPNGAPDSVMYGINEVGNQFEIDYLMK